MSHFALLPPPDPFPARGFDFRVVFGDPQEVGVELLGRHAGPDLVEEHQHRRLVPHAPLTAVFGAPLSHLHLEAVDGAAVHGGAVGEAARNPPLGVVESSCCLVANAGRRVRCQCNQPFWRVIAPTHAVRPCAMPAVMLWATQRWSRGGARGK